MRMYGNRRSWESGHSCARSQRATRFVGCCAQWTRRVHFTWRLYQGLSHRRSVCLLHIIKSILQIFHYLNIYKYKTNISTFLVPHLFPSLPIKINYGQHFYSYNVPKRFQHKSFLKIKISEKYIVFMQLKYRP